MAQGSFSAKVSAFVAETKPRMVAARNIAVEKAVEFMQTPVAEGGNMPVKDGFLRSSIVFTTGGDLPQTRQKPAEGVPYRYNADGLSLVLATAALDDQIVAVYTAAYAKVANYGGENRAARQFVGLTAQNWPTFVSRSSSEVQRRVILNRRADRRAGG